jgi:hypothetical protein
MQLAIEAIGRNPRRSGLTVAMLGVGMGSVLWLWSVARSFEDSVNDAVSNAMKADLTVSSVHIGSGFLESPVEDGLIEELQASRRARRGQRAHGTDRLRWRTGFGDAYDPPYFTTAELGQWPLARRGQQHVEEVARGTR